MAERDPKYSKWVARAGINFVNYSSFADKLRDLNEINKLLAHQPWKMNAGHIEKLSRSRFGTDNWSISEVVHAIIILTHFHALSSFVFSSGINNCLDGQDGSGGGTSVPCSRLTAKDLRAPPRSDSMDNELDMGMDPIKEKEDKELINQKESCDKKPISANNETSIQNTSVVVGADPTGLSLPLASVTSGLSSGINPGLSGDQKNQENSEEGKEATVAKEGMTVSETVSSPSCIMIKKAFVDDSPPPELAIGSPLNEGSVEVHTHFDTFLPRAGYRVMFHAREKYYYSDNNSENDLLGGTLTSFFIFREDESGNYTKIAADIHFTRIIVQLWFGSQEKCSLEENLHFLDDLIASPLVWS